MECILLSITMMVLFQFLLFAFLFQSLVNEMSLFNFINEKGKQVLSATLLFYCLFVYIFLKNTQFFLIFLFIPLILVLLVFVFFKYKNEKDLLFQLYSLLIPLESQMKLGLGFINAWQKVLEELESGEIKSKIQEITEVLKFQSSFQHSHKEIENFVKDLIIIYQSSNPLKRLKYLHRKIRVEQAFRIKSHRVLLQVRIQSAILGFFYFSLLVWTVITYKNQYIHLVLASFLLFCIGLFWILKTGRKMKWSV